MKQISVAELRNNLASILKELPVQIIDKKKGQIIAVLSLPEEIPSQAVPITNVHIEGVPQPLEETIIDYCWGWKIGTGHFEKGVKHKVKKVAYEDINGDIKWEYNLCDKCLKKFEGEVKRNGGRIIFK